jgi:hypothetical protein
MEMVGIRMMLSFDPAVAFELFTPSKYGTVLLLLRIYGLGDYDFNDVALNYQVIVKLNSLNLAVQMDIICRVRLMEQDLQTELESKYQTCLLQKQSVSGAVLTETTLL